MYSLFDGNKKAKSMKELNTGLANDPNKASIFQALNQDILIERYYSDNLIYMSNNKFCWMIVEQQEEKSNDLFGQTMWLYISWLKEIRLQAPGQFFLLTKLIVY